MKMKLLALMLLASGSIFARTHISGSGWASVHTQPLVDITLPRRCAAPAGLQRAASAPGPSRIHVCVSPVTIIRSAHATSGARVIGLGRPMQAHDGWGRVTRAVATTAWTLAL